MLTAISSGFLTLAISALLMEKAEAVARRVAKTVNFMVTTVISKSRNNMA